MIFHEVVEIVSFGGLDGLERKTVSQLVQWMSKFIVDSLMI